MKPRITLVLVAILALAITGTSTAATSHHAPQSKQKQTYLHLYTKVQKEHGKRAPGRNIVRYGLKGGKPATSRHIARSIVTLENILHPAPPPAPAVAAVASTSSYAPTQVQSYGGGGGAGGIAACIRQHENSGSYTGTDSTGTYGGAYQFDQATWQAAGGTGSPATAPAAEQDRVFAHWWPSHHGAWPVSGPACGG